MFLALIWSQFAWNVSEPSLGIVHDGLWDVYNDHHMGICAEKCSVAYGIDREAQDKHATESYERAALAWDKVRCA